MEVDDLGVLTHTGCTHTPIPARTEIEDQSRRELGELGSGDVHGVRGYCL